MNRIKSCCVICKYFLLISFLFSTRQCFPLHQFPIIRYRKSYTWQLNSIFVVLFKSVIQGRHIPKDFIPEILSHIRETTNWFSLFTVRILYSWKILNAKISIILHDLFWRFYIRTELEIKLRKIFPSKISCIIVSACLERLLLFVFIFNIALSHIVLSMPKGNPVTYQKVAWSPLYNISYEKRFVTGSENKNAHKTTFIHHDNCHTHGTYVL